MAPTQQDQQRRRHEQKSIGNNATKGLTDINCFGLGFHGNEHDANPEAHWPKIPKEVGTKPHTYVFVRSQTKEGFVPETHLQEN